MSHDTLCEMILSCQLLVGNWADLHANGLHLFNDVGGSGAITPGDVQGFFSFLGFVPPRSRRIQAGNVYFSHFRRFLLAVFMAAVTLCRASSLRRRGGDTIVRDSQHFPAPLDVRSSGAPDLRRLP